MSSAPLQDMPRPGGFPAISWERNVPARGPTGLALFVVAAGVTIFGFSKVIYGNQRRR